MPDDTRTPAAKPAPEMPARFEVPEFLVPKSLAEVRELARLIALAEWAPDSYRDLDGEYVQQKIELAIMHGATVGLGPIAAVQSIAVIDGMPTIWGDGALSIVERSGLLEDMVEEYVVDPEEGLAAICTMRRKRRPTPISNRFSMAMAEQAHLLEKEGPWQSYPQRMLKMRARSWTIRDGFADVLRGLHIREEVDDFIEIRGLIPADLMPEAAAGDRQRPRRMPAEPENAAREPSAPDREPRAQGGPGGPEAAAAEASGKQDNFTLADAEGGFIDVVGGDGLRTEFERIFFHPALSPDQIAGVWESNEVARAAITRLFGEEALRPAVERLRAAEAVRQNGAEEKERQRQKDTGRRKPKRQRPADGEAAEPAPSGPKIASTLSPADPRLVVAIDPAWGDQRVFRHYRAHLDALRDNGLASSAEIARFRAANHAIETRLRQKLPQLFAEIDGLGERDPRGTPQTAATPGLN